MEESRNDLIVRMHNEGHSVRAISDVVKMSISGVHKILASIIEKADVMPKIPSKVKLNGNEERFTNFGSYIRTNVNEYCHKETNEVIYLAFVREKKGKYGYFVKLDYYG